MFNFVLTDADAVALREDPQVYPQLDPARDLDGQEGTFVERLRAYIEFVIDDELVNHEDPDEIVIY